MREAITIANNEIHRLAGTRPEWHGMACVLTVVVVDERARDRRPRRRHAALQAARGRHREGHARPLAGRRARGRGRDLGARGDAAPAAQRGLSRRRLRAARAGRSGFHRRRRDSIRAGRGAAALQRRPDRPGRLVGDRSDGRRGSPGSRDGWSSALIDAANAPAAKTTSPSSTSRASEFATTRRRRAGRRHDAPPGTAARSRPTASSRERPVRVALLVLRGDAARRSRSSGCRPDWPVGQSAVRAVAVERRADSSSTRRVDRRGAERGRAGRRDRRRARRVPRSGLLLVSGVRLVSRVPRGATSACPATASEADAAVVADDITGAELVGFRIVGDAATPLGTGVLVQDSDLSIIDVEITGAANVAIDIAGVSRPSSWPATSTTTRARRWRFGPAPRRASRTTCSRETASRPNAPTPVILGERADRVSRQRVPRHRRRRRSAR